MGAVVKAVEANTDLPWVVLYVRRWLAAPLQLADGSVQHGTGDPAGVGDYAPNALGNFEFDVTLSYRRLERPRRATADG